jgi:hypothetical protein
LSIIKVVVHYKYNTLSMEQEVVYSSWLVVEEAHPLTVSATSIADWGEESIPRGGLAKGNSP